MLVAIEKKYETRALTSTTRRNNCNREKHEKPGFPLQELYCLLSISSEIKIPKIQFPSLLSEFKKSKMVNPNDKIFSLTLDFQTMRFYGFHFKILQEVAGGFVQMCAMAFMWV